MKPSLPEDIPFGAIVSLVNRSKYIFLNNRLRPLGLSAGQAPVLMLLSREENIIQERLVRHYRLDKGTIARAVGKLERGGYIRRIPDPDNRRAVRLFLTAKGQRVVPVLKAVTREWEERVLAGLSPDECADLRHLMGRAAQNSMAIPVKTGERCDDHG